MFILVDTRSCVLAVDNFNGAKISNRTIRCDHVLNYRRPKKEKKEAIKEGLVYLFVSFFSL